MKSEKDMSKVAQIDEKIIAKVARMKSGDLIWQQRKTELFTQNLDYLDTLPETERISVLGGINPTDPEKTRLSKKKWADQKAQADFLSEIQASITRGEIAAALSRRQELEMAARFEPLAKEMGVSLDSRTQQNLFSAEQKIKDLSVMQPVNQIRLRRFLVESATGIERLKLFYIKCARFAFPGGKISIIPSLENFSYIDKNGNEKIRPANNETAWISNTKTLSRELQELGIQNDVQIAIADTDIRDVRALPTSGEAAKNIRTYATKLQERYPELDITTFSELEKDLALEIPYRGLYFKSLAFLLTNGTNNPNVLKIQRPTLNQYGYSYDQIDDLVTTCKENQRRGYSVPISTKTVDTVTEEERLSQGRALDTDRCTYAFMRIYSCARIARDLAQIGVVLPAVGKNVTYVSDRKLKAVEFGFTANKMLGQEKQVVIFQKYEKE